MGVRVVLTGHYAGRTMTISGVHFTNGETYLPGPIANYDGLLRLLATYNAWPKGSEEYLAAIKRDKENGIGHSDSGTKDGPNDGTVGSDESGPGESEGHPDSPVIDAAGGLVPGGGGSPVESSDSQPNYLADQTRARLATVIKDLDPENDEHWTAAGLPKLSVIEEALGTGAVSRKDIEAIAPGYDRDSARAANM